MTPWTEFKRILLPTKAVSASPEVIEALHERTANFNIVRAVSQEVRYQVEAAVQWGGAEFYVRSPAVRTVVDTIASNVAQLDLRLYKEIAPDEREEQPDHPAMESLRHPNPSMSSDQFVRFMVKAFCLYDNAYSVKLRGDGAKRQFVVLPPERVKVNGPGLTPTVYRIWNLDGTESDPIPARDMLHWRGENFLDMRIGASRLETLRAVIVEEAAMQTQMIELAKSGMAEPVWVERPVEAPELSRDGLARLEEHTANRLQTLNKVPPVMEEGMKLHGFGVSPKDAEALAVRKYALQQVASLFGVPLGMVGLSENVEEARSEFYSETLPTITEAFCRQLNRSVLVDEYGEEDLYFEFDLDEKLMGDERLKALTSAAGVPPLLRNEARAKLNLKPVEGGDEPATPANMNVGDPTEIPEQPPTPRGAKPADNVMPIQNPAGPDQGGGAREGEPGVRPRQSFTDAVLKHIERLASQQRIEWSRSDREFTEDLERTGMNGDASMAATQINAELRQGLKSGERAEVFNRAKAEVPRLAARWMAPEEMKAYGLPEEVIWRRIGYSESEIDEMRALKLAESLAGASQEPEDH